ncbi:MAG: PIN domain-containing protein [Deferribacteraceae bacterium]|jgi:predicted nucleic acid-binding protein|nr:PIN domain-containing protein [Deferribacteraceae bacterium]
MNAFVLDACALIAYFAKENGAEIIKEIFERAIDNKDTIIFMHKINLLEVYYDVIKTYNEQEAQRMLEIVAEMPIKIIHELNDVVFKRAGLLKSKYRISLADSIALAESTTRSARLISSDHHEFDIIEKQEQVAIQWFR